MIPVAFFRDHTPFAPDWNRIRPAGASLSADVTAVRETRSAADFLRQQVFDLMAAGHAVTVTLGGLSGGRRCRSELQMLCGLLGEALQDSGASSDALGIVIDAMCLEAREAWNIRSEELGDGPLYFNLLQGTLPQGFWRHLWQLRSNDRLRLMYSRFVVSQTCLLADEIAGGVTSGPGLQVPTGSSWVTVEVDVSEFADNDGEFDVEGFERTLQEAVVNGDRFHDRMPWPTAQMRHDAWLNRRLAVNVAGIGTLVRGRDVDPGRFSTLDAMSGLLQQARRVLSATTRNLATRDGNVPALELADPGRLVPGGSIADGWARRWRQALEGAAVRNRNLLAVSPWSIFPRGCADFRYANLLPLLRFADVCPFGRPPDITDWNLRSFKNFHQQAAAVLHQRGAGDQIAVHA